MPTNRQIGDKLSKTLTKLVKDDIRKKDLIDTGAMLRSIVGDVSILGNGNIAIDVLAVDYFVYVSGNYDIMTDVLESNEWQKALELAVFNIIENKFNL